jgi:hypothetical protein
MPDQIAAATKDRVQGQLAATDRPIDRLVYERYGLSDAEIQIVEEATGR